MSSGSSAASAERIRHLDGLRGVAVTLVLLFHTFARWRLQIPFGAEFASFPLFAEGWLGVELFFMISGFVIFMTLDNCASFAAFIGRRWLRLFPAMLTATVLIFATGWFFWERPLGKPTWGDILAGLTFLQPEAWQSMIGISQRSLENSFWTLYVEVKFYLIGGAVYFLAGQRSAIAVIAALFFGTLAARYGGIDALGALDRVLDASFFGWFAAGALFYRWSRAPSPMRFGLAFAMGLLAPLAIEGPRLQWEIFAYGIVLLFAAASFEPKLQRLLSARPLLFLGFISYPLYLIHEDMTISLMIKIGRAMPWLPHLLNPVLPLAIVIAIAWLIAAFTEPWLRQELRRLWRFLRHDGAPDTAPPIAPQARR